MGCLSDSAFAQDDILDQIERGCTHGHAKGRVPEIAEKEQSDELEQRLRDIKVKIQDAKVDWYVVPSEDEHQSEEIGPSDERRSWISGFTGSAGTALIPASDDAPALLFVDSRYWIQAGKQVPKGWDVRRVGAKGGSGKDDVVGGWIDAVVDELEDGARIGIDPKLIALNIAQSIHTRLDSSSTKVVPLQENLIDKIRSCPPRSFDPIVPHPLIFAGESSASKLARIRAELDKRSPRRDWIYILPTLPAIAWLLNIRCPGDIPYCPVAYAYLVLTKDSCIVFVNKDKVGDEVKGLWDEVGVEIRKYGAEEVGSYVKEAFTRLKDGNEKKAIKVFAPKECSWAISQASSPAEIEIISCPVDIAKAVKNATEIEGFRKAYLRDGRAMVRWMAFLEQKILKDQRPVGEWAAAQVLLRYRRQEENFAGLAYGDISASGPNGALPHYAPARGAESVIDPDAPYVIDSGGQYLDGTIDTTRTFYLGKNPSDEIKRTYTRVLQCHIAAATATFPRGMDADKLVMLGKASLYQDGLDYGHGLGHGIGSYLAVHEFPIFPHGVSFESGHVTSIEPGFYKEGEYGIRTESVYVCKSVDTMFEFGGHKWLGWERLTQVPIMTNMVDWSLMRKDQIVWLNEHNKSVKETLEPLLQEDEDKDARGWLNRVTKPKKIWPWT